MSASTNKRAQVRRLVERLLNGERKPELLHRMMTWLRTRSYGYRTVKEIGDAIAHFDERDQGLIFDRILDFFDSNVLIYRSTLNGEQAIPPAGMRARAIVASSRYVNPADVKKVTRIGYKAAMKAALSAAAKLDAGLSGLTKEEINSINYFTGRLTVSPAMTQDDVEADLKACLIKNGLLTEDEGPALSAVVSYLCAYMITLMHQAEIKLGDGVVGFLSAGIARPQEGGTLAIMGAAPVNEANNILVSFAVFRTNCGPEWCSDEIQALALQDPGSQWTQSVEMDESGIIHFAD